MPANDRSRGLSSPVQYARGVGPGRASLLKRLGLETLEDLFTHFPRRYEDRAHIKPISEMVVGKQETVLGEVLAITLKRFRRSISLVQMGVGDGTGLVTVCWFNQPYMKDRFKAGDKLYLYGRLQLNRSKKPVIYNPEYEFVEATPTPHPGPPPLTQPSPAGRGLQGTDRGREQSLGGGEAENSIHMGRIVPVYPLTEGLQQRAIRSVLWQFLEQYLPQAEENLPAALLEEKKWMSKQQALRQIHFPESFALQARARERLAYEELFYFQLALGVRKNAIKATPRGFAHQTRGAKVLAFLRSLPFTLTRAQQRVINQIRHDMGSPYPMNRLVQGDVGCGKTAIATAAAMMSLDSGCQTALMVPTEILAEQHTRNLEKLLAGLDVRLGLLVGGPDNAKKRELLREVAEGKIDILVGTHALIQDAVTFSRLGLVIVDEQHKFGVVQRESIRSKGLCPDVLVMTATPIPRTLALTVYGDLEESVVDELPPGRKKIASFWIAPKKLPTAYEFIRKEIRAGHQAYVIYPLVEDSPKVSSKAVISMAKNLATHIFPDLKVGLLYGKMKGSEKDKVMQEFAAGAIQVLVSTSVVEVGIDVANATCMMVENAERFGLAQLHQLRGRIGRGSAASTFIMVSDPTTSEGYARLSVLKESQDGFRIAEEDLKIRGPGEFFGVRQHGMPELKLASLVTDRNLLEKAREDALGLLRKDPAMNEAQHQSAAEVLRRCYGGLLDKISVG